MKNTGTVQVTTPTEREIVMTHLFDAPRRLIFDALTKPELAQALVARAPGWTMVVCEIDLRVGGAYRYVWRNTKELIWGWAAPIAR